MSAQFRKEHLEREEKEKKTRSQRKTKVLHHMTFGKNTDQSEGKDTSSKNLKKNVVILEDNGTDEEDKNLSEIRLQEDTDNEQDVGTIDKNDVADTNNTAFQ